MGSKDKKDKKQKKEEDEEEVEVKKDKKDKKDKKEKKDKKKKADSDDEAEEEETAGNAKSLPTGPAPSYATPIVEGDKLETILKYVAKMRDAQKNKEVKQGLIRGVKWATKAIKKKNKGFVLIAADAIPIDIWAHLPLYCKESKIPFVFVPSIYSFRTSLFKPQVCVMAVQPQSGELKTQYDKVLKIVESLQQ